MKRKHVCLIGPVYSGKTVFLYLMKRKLLSSDFNDTIGKFYFDDVSTNNFERKIENSIINGDWPDPTDKDADQIILQIHLLKKAFFKNELTFLIADVAGEIFLDISKELTEDNYYAIQSVLEADAYIFMVDVKQIIEKRAINFYNNFIRNFKEEILQLQGAKKHPRKALVLLNKSDVIKNNLKDKYYNEKDAKNFLSQHMDIFLGNLRDTFRLENIHFAWHSNVAKTIQTGDSGTELPDYEAFKEVDAGLYCNAFIKFLKSVSEK